MALHALATRNPDMGMKSDSPVAPISENRVFRVVPLGLLLIMVVAVVIRVAYVTPLDSTKLNWADEREYDKIAWHLAQTGQYESSAILTTPGLPTFLAVIYKVFGHEYRAGRIIQALLSAILVLAVFRIADMLFNRTTAYLTALGVTFYPPFIYLVGVFYAEFLYTLLIAVTVCLLIQWQQRQRTGWLVAAGVLMGITTLCRPVFLPFIPLAAVYVWWQAPRNTKLRLAITVGVVASAIILPWTVRNAIVYKKFMPVSTGFGMHLWRGNNDVAVGDAYDRYLMPLDALWQERAQRLLSADQRAALTEHFHQVDAEIAHVDEITWDNRWSREGSEWIKAHPGKFVVLCVRRVMTLYSAMASMKTQNELSSGRYQLVAALSFYPVLALGLVGMVLAVRRCKASLLLHGLIVLNLMPYVPTPPATRYRLPIDTYWIMFAALAVVTAWELMDMGSRRTNVPPPTPTVPASS